MVESTIKKKMMDLASPLVISVVVHKYPITV